MNIVTKFFLAFALLVSGFSAYAADLNLFTFLGANPLKGVEVELDGVVVGETGQQGSYSGELKPGKHRIVLQKRGAELAKYAFEVAEGQSADITFGFVNFLDEPEVTLERYSGSETGAPGQVSGYVTNTGTFAVAGATVTLEGTALSVVTDEAGAFQLEAPRGVYTLLVEHPEYQTASLGGLRVVANVGVEANVTLRQESTAVTTDGSVEEVVVLGTYKPATSTVDMERFSTAVTDAISLDDLLRFGDSDVAASLKRVVGVSISGGKYAVVRGLDGRYVSSTLNGMLMPSTDPFRRDVQLDLFPSEILGGIEIQKNFTADLPGDTTGGIIKMTTRGMPDDRVHGVSLSLGVVSGTTGEQLISYEGSGSDRFGFDDGLRELPSSIDAASNGGRSSLSAQESARLAPQLPNIWNTRKTQATPNMGLGYTLGDLFEMENGTLGLYGSASYDSQWSSRQDAKLDDLRARSDYQWDVYSAAMNAYLVAAYDDDRGWSLSSKTILLRDSEDRTSIENGFDKREDNDFTEVTLEWVERQFLAQQFEGKLFLLDDHELSWRAGLSQTSRYSPDRRTYVFLGDFASISTIERSYGDLTEDGFDVGLDYKLPWEISNDLFVTLKAGVLANTRDRDVELVRIGVRQGSNPISLNQDLETLLQAANFQNDAFRLAGRSTTTDSYRAEQEASAIYLASETEVGEALTLLAGVRKDDYRVDLSFPNSPTTAVNRESNEILPSVGVIYRVGDDWQLRGSYSATVSRPNITELSPSRYFDENGREHIGCPTCTESTVDNFDFRLEYYFGDDSSASVAVFHKLIDQPLERVVPDGSGSATRALTFRNAEEAEVQGLELDAAHTLVDSLDHGLKISGNVAFISSQITLDEVGARLEADPTRDLQGQSPFLANLQVAYDHFGTDQKATLLINYFDDRIDAVQRVQPVRKESGRATVNFNYEVGVGASSKLKLKVKNLLDAKTEYTQAGKVIEQYRRGIELGLGYSIDF